MGYDSKIIIVDRREHKDKDGNLVCVYGAEIAQFDLCKMGYNKYPVDNYDVLRSFRELFTIPIDFDLSVQNEDSNKEYPAEYWREDMYGEHCKYTTDIKSVMAWLRQSEEHEHYRRASLLLDFLASLLNHAHDWAQLCLVHYGY